LLILRGVTDLVNENEGEAYGNLAFFQLATEKVMAEFVKALPDWINAGSIV